MISWKGLPEFFILNRKKGKKSGKGEGQRESVRERQSIVIGEK
jgi:hypothetical protein